MAPQNDITRDFSESQKNVLHGRSPVFEFRRSMSRSHWALAATSLVPRCRFWKGMKITGGS